MGNCCASKQPQKKPSRGGGGAGGDKVAIGENGRKIVLLGEMSTGKTCLVLRLVKNEFSEKELPTIGFAAHKHKQCHQVHFFLLLGICDSAAFMVHKMNVDDKTVKLEIWDTAGQERFVCTTPEVTFSRTLLLPLCGAHSRGVFLAARRGRWRRCTTRAQPPQ